MRNIQAFGRTGRPAAEYQLYVNRKTEHGFALLRSYVLLVARQIYQTLQARLPLSSQLVTPRSPTSGLN